jgi:uncharacterized protein YijF (DUF1287 family)
MVRRILVILPSLFLSIGATAGTAEELVAAARAQIGMTTLYDGSYQKIAYPGGDVPLDRGVCTDVVVRAYRNIGIDLQARVHEDMRRAWSAYPHPTKWGLRTTDTNIDHRRVPNLDVFLRRHGTALAVSNKAADFRPGDIVVWRLPMDLPHIGIVSDKISSAGVPLVIHNIASGVRMADVLFAYTITGHYRYLPADTSALTTKPYAAAGKRHARHESD